MRNNGKWYQVISGYIKKKKRGLSEYKTIGIIQDYLHLLYQAIRQSAIEITKFIIHPFHYKT